MISNSSNGMDWTNFIITDEDIREAIKNLESNNIEEEVQIGLKNDKDFKKVSYKIKNTFIFIFFFLIPLVSNLIQIAECVEEVVIPNVDSFIEQKREGLFQSQKASLKWLDNELKKDVSEQITKNFRIVIKDDLIV